MATAPVLSTAQSDKTFEYDKFNASQISRPYLGEYSNLTEALRQYYSIDKLIATLKDKYHKITLQFPDELVADSSHVVQMLQTALSRDQYEVWVLADTSYSSCCVDEVAAEHVSGDVVVHFGDACFTPVSSIASVHVLGVPSVDVAAISAQFRTAYPDNSDPILLMANAPYTCVLESIYEVLQSEYKQLYWADIYTSERVLGHNSTSNGTIIGNRIVKGQSNEASIVPSEFNLFHITMPRPAQLLKLSVEFNSVTVCDPLNMNISTGPFPKLQRRYRYMHEARTAATIGILVNTLSLQNTRKIVDLVADWIKNAHKKYYTFVVGKPNVAKLANFEAVDVWCVLGCSQGGIIIDESNEYYKPIITPYELRLALNSEVSWTGQWVSEFNEVLNMDKDQSLDRETEPSDSNHDEEESYAPEFSAVTGKYVSTSQPLRQIKHLQIETSEPKTENRLVAQFSKSVVLKNDVSTSAVVLQNRQWTGLGSDFAEVGDEEGAEIEEGRFGIARGYDK